MNILKYVIFINNVTNYAYVYEFRPSTFKIEYNNYFFKGKSLIRRYDKYFLGCSFTYSKFTPFFYSSIDEILINHFELFL